MTYLNAKNKIHFEGKYIRRQVEPQRENSFEDFKVTQMSQTPALKFLQVSEL